MPTYTLVTFGCQMNQHDSERIGEVLRGAGYEERESVEQADLILLNTCSVREKAEQKLRSEVGRLGLLKKARPDLVIAVAGCVAQQEGERLVKRMPQIDVVVGPDCIAELPRLLSELDRGAPSQVRTGFDVERPSFLSAAPTPGRQGVTAFVTVMKGCNERCSFCIVPTTRGPERYRPAREILSEVEALVTAGVREITLLGQTVNSYRDPEQRLAAEARRLAAGSSFGERRADDDESEFSTLLVRIAERAPALLRLRYTSPHPRHLTRSLIRAHAELSVLPRHVHLPVQSGSDRVLRRMIRRYNVAEYHERVAALRDAVPGVTLSTDVIVGFPGETEQDFEATLQLVDALQFTNLYGFKYSARPFTPALRLGDDVPEVEKSRRLDELFRVADAIRHRHLRSRVGAVEQVMVEGRGRAEEFSGRAEHNEIVHIQSPRVDPTARLVSVRIEQAFKNSLAGALVDESGLPPWELTPMSLPRRSLTVLAS